VRVTEPVVEHAPPSVDDALDRVVRAESGRLTGALVRLLGDWDLAEEIVQDALVVALERWPREGVPPNPGAWLMTTARRRALDRLRRIARYREKLAVLAESAEEADGEATVPADGPAGADDRLRLLFTCCHPALAREAQIALTLKTVAGLSTAQIARAFLVPEPTVAQRLVRAKAKIRQAGIPYRVPEASEMPARLAEVLRVLYLVFNEGYLATDGDAGERRDLCRDADWLCGLLVELMPDEPEALGLLALMRLHLARADARFASDGGLVLLRDQDRTRWDRASIAAASDLVERALRVGRPGPYALQAAIAACHAEAPTYEATDWAQIVGLYDALLRLEPSPVVALNRAVALAEIAGADAALAAIEALTVPLDRYHLFHAARGEMLSRVGRKDEARLAIRRALALTGNQAEQRLLEERLGWLAGSAAQRGDAVSATAE
jgi:RNA polymerase sigma-70 factor (ECF subfamily)